MQRVGYAAVFISKENNTDMRRVIQFSIVAIILLSACATQKSYYETREGKRKQRYYNAIQYGQKDVPKKKF